ncbi:MAG TPA: PP2C family protein-serine/threonine phosphatase [Kofleriaceae bacterium]|nr:PP2C family protein-serine/threonine phosphatase [Kofleriaceae bacterium]
MSRVRAAAVELGAAACAAGGAWAVARGLAGAPEPAARWILAGALGGGLALGHAALRAAGRRRALDPAVVARDVMEARRYLAECAATGIDTADRVARLTEGLGLLLADAADLREVRIERTDEHGRLDPRVRAWLVANRAPMSAAHLGELALGGLRQPVEAYVLGLGADVVLPLVHRERLVGVATARGPARSAVRGRRAGAVRAVQRAAAAALGELVLRAQIEQRAGVTQEVEAAASVQRAAAPGTSAEELGGCRVVRFYAPARQFSGAWWTARELADGRLFAAVGEVTARGVPAALLSATALGVCEAANRALAGRIEIDGLLGLLDGSVRQAGRGAFSMSCLALLVDVRAREVTFASAGHPFPYLCRPWMGAGARGALRAMVSRGSHLGGQDEPRATITTLSIAPGDVMVLYTSSLTDARDPAGQTFGERRLQHVLRRASLVGPTGPDGGELADQIGDQVLGHVGDRPLDDDVLVATVEVRA